MADNENDDDLVDYDEEEVRITATSANPIRSSTDPLGAAISVYTSNAQKYVLFIR